MTMREDDLVNEDGIPLSPAHKALDEKIDKVYDHLNECKEEMIRHFDESMIGHLEQRHADLIHLDAPFEEFFPGQSAGSVLQSISMMAAQFPMLASAVLGTPKDAFFGGGREADGMVSKQAVMESQMRDLHSKLGNGKQIKAGLSWADRAGVVLGIAFIMLARKFGLL